MFEPKGVTRKERLILSVFNRFPQQILSSLSNDERFLNPYDKHASNKFTIHISMN